MPDLDQFVKSLTETTRSKKALWLPVSNGFQLESAGGDVVLLRPKEDEPVIIVVKTPQGTEVMNTSEVNGLGDLYRAASIAGMENLLRSIEDSIQGSNRFCSELEAADISTLPRSLLLKDELNLYERVAGKWFLDFSHGSEQVQITKEGLYLSGPRKGSLTEKYQLRLIAVSEDQMTIEWAKDSLRGGRYQIEVLKLDDDRPSLLIGEAKHDRHKLRYERQG